MPTTAVEGILPGIDVITNATDAVDFLGPDGKKVKHGRNSNNLKEDKPISQQSPLLETRESKTVEIKPIENNEREPSDYTVWVQDH